MKLGMTGEYPSGKLNDADEGELSLAVAADKSTGKILLQFGKAVAWLGMNADEARGLGRLLIQKADELPETSELDWEKALTHFRRVRKTYQDLVGTPGVNSSLALELIFHPISERYHRGERTPELHAEMMAVE